MSATGYRLQALGCPLQAVRCPLSATGFWLLILYRKKKTTRGTENIEKNLRVLRVSVVNKISCQLPKYYCQIVIVQKHFALTKTASSNNKKAD